MTTRIRYTREDAGAHPANAHAAYASTLKRAPQHALIRLEQTLSEITGPRFDHEHVSAADADLTSSIEGYRAPEGSTYTVSHSSKAR